MVQESCEAVKKRMVRLSHSSSTIKQEGEGGEEGHGINISVARLQGHLAGQVTHVAECQHQQETQQQELQVDGGATGSRMTSHDLLNL